MKVSLKIKIRNPGKSLTLFKPIMNHTHYRFHQSKTAFNSRYD